MKLVITLILLLFIKFGLAQSSITGVIKDANNNEPLEGVTITETGTTNATLSAVDGTFSIKLQSKNSALSFSFIGFNTLEIKNSGQSSINVFLFPANTSLKDVVVTALGIHCLLYTSPSPRDS